MATKTAKLPIELYHPTLPGVTHTVETAEERDEWTAAGWTEDAPEFDSAAGITAEDDSSAPKVIKGTAA